MRDELPRVTTIRAATDHLLLPPEGQNDACGERIGESEDGTYQQAAYVINRRPAENSCQSSSFT
jgi:hypothetical protein